MTVLVVGASGATGRLLVRELLDRGRSVRAVVRSTAALPAQIRDHPSLSIVHANLLELDVRELSRLADGCTAIASCLGHTMSFKGLFGSPRRWVTDVVRRLCEAVRANQPSQPVRFVLMNTAGNRNRNLDEPVSIAQSLVLALLRCLLPPHADNEQAADHLRVDVGQGDRWIEWAVVRPDTLIDADQASGYVLHRSPTRSAIFNAGKTRRIHVAQFMAGLATDDAVWTRWKGEMPVVYDTGFD